MENYYEVLEVAQKATQKEIKKSYYRLAKKYHPDHNRNDPAAAAKFKAVGEAYRVLSDSGARAEYDRLLAREPVASKAAAATDSVKRSPAQTSRAGNKGIDLERLNETFASFWGYDPKTKKVTNEDKLNTYVAKEQKKNPLDTTEIFERFMGFKK